MAVRAVTFDFWNTLVREDRSRSGPRRIDAWLAVLEGEGMAVEREAIDAAFAEGWSIFEEHWRRNLRYRAEDSVDFSLGRLGLDPPSAVRDALVAAFTDPRPEHDPPLLPHVPECLWALRAADVRIGIICDVGLTPSRTLRRMLERHGVLQHFDHWSFSDEVGVFKPDPAIFRHALAGLGIDDPAEVAHIGDLRRTDVAGANAMGITSVRFTGAFDDPGRPGDDATFDADLVVADHADLPAALGLA